MARPHGLAARPARRADCGPGDGRSRDPRRRHAGRRAGAWHGKTKTGRFWVYLRDERPHAGTAPPAVLYSYTPDRIGAMKWSDASLMPGPPRVAEFGCWSHVRRGFFDEYVLHKVAIAKEALDRIGALFDIERPIVGSPPDIRRAVRQRTARPKIDELAIWLDAQLAKIRGKSDQARTIRYAPSRWPALTRFLDDGRLEISNNAAENKIRPAALGRKNWLFCGSDTGGTRAAAFYALIGTARMNGIEPQAWLTGVIARIGAYPIHRFAELLPWDWSPTATQSVAA